MPVPRWPTARADRPSRVATGALRRTCRAIAGSLLWLGLCAGTLSVFASHPVFALGVWQDSEPMGLVFYAAASACFAGLALLCLDGAAVVRALCHPAVLAPAALGAWSLAVAPFVPFPMLSVFGPPQNSLGALWYLAFAAFVASAIVLRANRRMFASLVAIAAMTALAAAAFNLWRIDWPESVRDRLLWLPRATLLEFNEYQAYYALALLALALVMARERRRLAAGLLAAAGVVSLLVSRNRAAMVASVLAFLPLVPAAWPPRASRRRPLRDGIAVAAISVIGLGSYLTVRLLDLRQLAPTLWSRRLIFEGVEPSLLDRAGAAVIGHGWGRYADFLVANLSLSGIRLYNPDWAGLGRDLFHSHHVFLEALFAAGAPGLLLAAAIPVALILGARHRRRGIAIAFVLSWLVVDCFWFMMPATLPVLALACGALAESGRSLCWRWTRGPWAIAWLALLVVTAAGVVELTGEARAMSRLIGCLTPDHAAECRDIDVATDLRGAEHGLASVVGDTVPALLRSDRPLADGQVDAVRRVLAEAERRDMVGRPASLLTLQLADSYAAVAFTDGADRVLPPAALFNAWTRVLRDVLHRTPQRLDVLVPYLSWLLVRGQHADIEAMLVRARRVDADHPVVLWFSGIEALKPGDEAKREQALAQMRRALERGLERFMPVDPSIKARLTAGAAK